MALSQQDFDMLCSPLPMEYGHEFREGSLPQDKSWCNWLVYTVEGPVIERLNEVDPGWELVITNTESGNACTAWGYLTVCGTTRHGAGGGKDDKGAATDLLKRCARLFGVGLYLKTAPLFWTKYGPQLKYKERAAFEKEAAQKFYTWYRKTFRASSPAQPQAAPARTQQRETAPSTRGNATPPQSELDKHLGPRKPPNARASNVDHAQRAQDAMAAGDNGEYPDTMPPGNKRFNHAAWKLLKPYFVQSGLTDNDFHAFKRLQNIAHSANSSGAKGTPWNTLHTLDWTCNDVFEAFIARAAEKQAES